MEYVSGSTATVNYTIPVSAAADSVMTQYHLEVLNTTLGTKKNVAAATITAATGLLTGTVGFTGVPTPDVGVYMLTVMYADNADLDTAGMKPVGYAAIQKIAVVSTITVT